MNRRAAVYQSTKVPAQGQTIWKLTVLPLHLININLLRDFPHFEKYYIFIFLIQISSVSLVPDTDPHRKHRSLSTL